MATSRGYYLQELRRAKVNVDMIYRHLDRVLEAYSQDHPDIAVAAGAIMDALVLIEDTIDKIIDSI